MQVVGVGFGRTGTVSLKTALERLGFGPCYQMQTVIDEPRRASDWTAAAAGAPDWDATFAGFRSTVEWPGAAFWPALVRRYPDARVILTVRDPDAWAASARRTIFRDMTRLDRQLGRVRRRAQPQTTAVYRMIGEVVVGGVFGGEISDPLHLAEVFRRHAAEVERTVPADRLLVYDVRQGWPPLCAFLDVPVPAAPFPHANDAAAFRRKEWIDVGRALIASRRSRAGRHARA
jgi:hypothetical protein